MMTVKNKMNFSIRLEQEDDYRRVENLTREAFWNSYKPGCDEHLIGDFRKEISI